MIRYALALLAGALAIAGGHWLSGHPGGGAQVLSWFFTVAGGSMIGLTVALLILERQTRD